MLKFYVFNRLIDCFNRRFGYYIYISTTQIDNLMNKITLTFTFFLCALLATAQVSPKEKEALLDLYNVTNGSEWSSSWNIDQPVSSWKGVTILNDKVIALTLTNNNLEGSLPESIGNLVHLKVLNLHKNKISGVIPQSIQNLKNLKSLNLSFNALAGSIPGEITQLVQLEYIDLFFNGLEGELPQDINQLKKLRRLSLYNNYLSGTIPQAITSLDNMKDLQLSSNQFEGELPKGLTTMASLKRLGVFDNNFIGVVPDLAHLEELTTTNNNFTTSGIAIVGGK